jgi:hypothetical protein
MRLFGLGPPFLMNQFSERIAIDWPHSLERVLMFASQRAGQAVLAFDLDSTVFDNRPRQARILREFGRAQNIVSLQKAQAFHFVNGWDLRAACVASGMASADAEFIFQELKRYWGARFFTSEYCRYDIEIVGAPRFLHACLKTGARLVYVTGRHERMRAGTIEAMERCGMPVPGPAVGLLMKPSAQEDDDAYKRVAHQVLSELGVVVAAFDNEPTHINDYAMRFAECLPVHLATDHSGREVALHERVISIPHFAW